MGGFVATRRGRLTRPLMVVAHRCLGLALAGFLALAGLTGSVLTFQHELDAWLNPALFRAQTRGPALPPSALIAALARFEPRAQPIQLTLATTPGMTVMIGVAARPDPRTGARAPLGYSQVFIDPASGHIQGTRQSGACCLQRENLIGFLYDLHFTLHLPGLWGVWVMGVVAFVWMLDSGIGFYLTLPPRAALSFWRRWAPAWKIKRDAGPARRIYDLHRANGLWFWPLLLMLALSSLKLNLDAEIFKPMVSLFSPVTPTVYETRGPFQNTEALLSFDMAYARGLQEAARRGWDLPLSQLYHERAYGLYAVRFGTPDTPGFGRRWLYFDHHDGHLLGDSIPGTGSAGDVFSALQLPLHGGKLIGLPGRILICLTGVAIVLLSVTGVLIWWRKRR